MLRHSKNRNVNGGKSDSFVAQF